MKHALNVIQNQVGIFFEIQV